MLLIMKALLIPTHKFYTLFMKFRNFLQSLFLSLMLIAGLNTSFHFLSKDLGVIIFSAGSVGLIGTIIMKLVCGDFQKRENRNMREEKRGH